MCALCMVSQVFASPQNAEPAAPVPATQPAPSLPALEDWQSLQAKGRALLRAGDAAAAVECLRQAVMKAPLTEITPMVDLARAYRLSNNWQSIVQLLAPRVAALDDAGLILLAEAYDGAGESQHAEDLLSKAVRDLPDHETLWLVLIDRTISHRQYGLAVRYVAQARHRVGASARLDYRAAVAYFHMGQGLGKTRVVRIPDGQPGQFVAAGLLIDRRTDSNEFLCCPPESAMYCLRRALDAGFDEPEAHCMHARLWIEARRPETAFAIIQNHEADWIESKSDELLGTMADIALACGKIEEYLRYARRRAECTPQKREEILFEAYLAAARQYNLRGDANMWRELLCRAIALRPDDANVMLQLGDAFWETDQHDQARLWYRRVLEREPRHTERRRILERLEE